MSQQTYPPTIPQMAGRRNRSVPEIYPGFASVSQAVSSDDAHAHATAARTALPEHASQP